LTPRPESETLIEAALDRIGDRSRRLSVLDLGTGSGCLILALLSEWPKAWGLGVDLNAEALAVAQINARDLGFADRASFLRGDWTAALAGRFDVIVVNPPYIRDDEIPRLEPEVSCHEPRLALSGGPDGLDAFRAVAPALPELLTSDGAAFLEVGAGQADSVINVLAESGLRISGVRSDLAGISRCLIAERENAGIGKKKVGKRVNPD
jgi:release factor glutamine methyltransferase